MYCSRAQLGALGEARAAAYLAAAGYRILAQNVRVDGVEIDLIALHARVLVFVEVKTRRGTTHGRAEEAVDLRKQMRLVRGACGWLQEQRQTGASLAREIRGMRFDVIACDLEPRACLPATNHSPGTSTAEERANWRIRHFENAFDANF